jgi:hypothetical protein
LRIDRQRRRAAGLEVLPGRHRTASSVTDSRVTFAGLFEKICKVMDAGEEVLLEATGE